MDWTDNSDNEDGFEISNGETRTTVGASATTYTWKGLSPGSYTCFKVRSFNSGGDSAFIPDESPYYKCATTPRNTGTSPTTVSVPGNRPWTDTGINLAKDSTITISANGTIKIAGSDPGKTPDGDKGCKGDKNNVAPDLTCVALIGRIGDGTPFEVGSSKTLSAPTAGRLYLGVNDSFFDDNSGNWTADIKVTEK